LLLVYQKILIELASQHIDIVHPLALALPFLQFCKSFFAHESEYALCGLFKNH